MNFLHTTAPEIRVVDSRLNHSLFQHSDLHASRFEHCDLGGVAFEGCRFDGATLDGVAISELLECWARSRRDTRPEAAPKPGAAGTGRLFEDEDTGRG
jgi:hypothetical protein